MKKLLSLVLSVLLITAFLPISKTYASASYASNVVMPTYVDSEGNPIPYTMGEEVPATIMTAPATAIENDLGILPFQNLFEIAAGTSGDKHIKVAAAPGSGILFYVDIPDMGSEYRVGLFADHSRGSAFQYQGRTWYMLKEGDSAWSASPKTAAYGLDLSGYKGYIYIPLSTLAQASSGGKPFGAGEAVTGMMYRFPTVPENKKLVVSAPVIVSGDIDASMTDVVLPTADKVSDGTNEWKYFVNGEETPSTGGSGNVGEGEESGSGSEGGEGEDPPETQPDYKLPAYTGAAIDYSNISIMNVTVGKLNGVVTVGESVPESAVLVSSKESKGISGTVEAVDARNGITNYPTFKFNKKSGSYSDWITYASFVLDMDVSPAGVTNVLYYVEMPSDKTVSGAMLWNFVNENDEVYYNTMYSGYLDIMATNETAWTELKVSEYKFTLPRGFKGYIKVNTGNIRSQSSSPAGGSEAFKADTKKRLRTADIYLFDLEKTDTVYIAAPVVATTEGAVPYAVFVDDEVNAARNIFTGAVLTESDLDEFAGSGAGDLIEGEIPEIDYKIPEYTGVAYNYDGKEFARIKQFILQDNIAKGYAIPYTTFNDGHADKNNGYSKLVDPLIGISNMPFFSITKTTGNPAESNVTVATWHPKKFETANANVGAILQYLKMPSDLEKAFCSIFMTAFDENYLAMNIAPYNGTIYYMEKGTTEWVAARITSYWFELPKGFEGYVMYDTKTLRAQNGGTEWGSGWTVYNYILRVANLNNQTVVASAPFWADGVGYADFACYLNDETAAVRDVFTGEVISSDEMNKRIGEPNYWIPHHNGDVENYKDCQVMRTKNLSLCRAVYLDRPFSTRALLAASGTSAKPVESIQPLSNYPAVEITNSGNEKENQVNLFFDYDMSAGGDNVLYYLKAPKSTETKLRFSWLWTNTNNPEHKTGAYNSSGTAYLMSKNSRKWETVDIKNYYITIPAGFEGYVRVEIAKLYCVYGYDENGNMDSSNTPNVDHYSLAKNPGEWGLNNVYVFWNGIQDGESATFSVPILASNIEDTSNSPWATFHDGENFARDIFAGNILKASELVCNHEYDGDCDKECNVCHAVRTTNNEHTYDNETDSSCNVCGYERLDINEITSNKHTVDGNNISKITAGTTVSSLLSNLNEGEYCKVYKGNTEVSGNTAVGTGMVVKIMDGNTIKASYTIVVTGDTNGDGAISVTDMIAIKAHILNKSTLSGVYAKAANTNGDSGISITDFIQVKAKILGKGEIVAR